MGALDLRRIGTGVVVTRKRWDAAELGVYRSRWLAPSAWNIGETSGMCSGVSVRRLVPSVWSIGEIWDVF
ncbi:hypothetical protein [Nocardia sp. JCM 34519]|uniref:hypothetical protein n=1 Tax=Nocardia sp. JCM 34519 TaxID=2876118 RepID=UPI001CE44703|nr:hypothetical protein [Nocardia sp. JCM 34519]